MKSKLLQHPVQFFDAPTQIVNVFRLGFLVPVAIINLSTFHNLNPFRRTLRGDNQIHDPLAPPSGLTGAGRANR